MTDQWDWNSWVRARTPEICTIVAVLLLSIWYYHEIIFWFPSHIHAWTQSDRLALAYGFLDNGMNFFLPSTYNIFTPQGITGVDFPLHEYIVAWIMKLTGVHQPAVFRVYTLLYSAVGYVFLYKLVCRYSGSGWKAAFTVLFVFTCPIITYYQAGFIPSATSLASSFIGFYFYISWKWTSKRRDLYAGIIFLTLAALPRLSVNVVLFAVLLTEIHDWYRNRKIDRPALLAFAIAYVVILAALAYKTYLNSAYGSRFLTNLLPADNATDLWAISKSVWERWHEQLLTQFHWLVFFIAALSVLWVAFRSRLEREDRTMAILGLLLLGGSAAFYLALAKQFVDHEYYFMDSLYQGIVIILIIGLKFIDPSKELLRVTWVALLAGALVGMASGSMDVQNEKYAITTWDRGEVTRKNFTGIDKFLDSLGISTNARFLVYEAYSTNTPLLLMRRKGYTVLNSHEENIRRALDLDFDYIAIQDCYIASDVISNANWITDCLVRVAGNGSVSVFEYEPCDREGPGSTPVEEVLGLDSLLLQAGCYPGENPDSSDARVSNCARSIDADVEFGPTYSPEVSAVPQNAILLVTIEYDVASTADLPLNYNLDLSAKDETGNEYYTSHPVKIKRHGSGRFYGTFDLSGYDDLTEIKTYVWNRYRKDTGIRKVLFEVYGSVEDH